jgi:hypothetical protein
MFSLMISSFEGWDTLITFFGILTVIDFFWKLLSSEDISNPDHDVINPIEMIYPKHEDLQELYFLALNGKETEIKERLDTLKDQEHTLLCFFYVLYPLIEESQVEAYTDLLAEALFQTSPD